MTGASATDDLAYVRQFVGLSDSELGGRSILHAVADGQPAMPGSALADRG